MTRSPTTFNIIADQTLPFAFNFCIYKRHLDVFYWLFEFSMSPLLGVTPLKWNLFCMDASLAPFEVLKTITVDIPFVTIRNRAKRYSKGSVFVDAKSTVKNVCLCIEAKYYPRLLHPQLMWAFRVINVGQTTDEGDWRFKKLKKKSHGHDLTWVKP